MSKLALFHNFKKHGRRSEKGREELFLVACVARGVARFCVHVFFLALFCTLLIDFYLPINRTLSVVKCLLNDSRG